MTTATVSAATRAYTIDHKWDTQLISMLTKEEIAESLNNARNAHPDLFSYIGVVKKSQPKEVLVELARQVATTLKIEHEKEEAANAQQHAADLERDLQHPRFLNTVLALAATYGEVAKDAREKINESMAKLQEDVKGQLYWQFERLAHQSHLESYALETGNYYYKEVYEKKAMTIEQVREQLADRAKYYVDRVMDRSFSQSTNAASNLMDLEEFKVIRIMAKMAQRACEAFETDLVAEVDAPFQVKYVRRFW
jgi:hypothetical protein